MVECSYFAVDSMAIETYGESWIAGLLTSDDVMLYMFILRIYFTVDGMAIEMYGESWIAGLLTSDDMLYMAGFETT